jgi:hypothetical protein
VVPRTTPAGRELLPHEALLFDRKEGLLNVETVETYSTLDQMASETLITVAQTCSFFNPTNSINL